MFLVYLACLLFLHAHLSFGSVHRGCCHPPLISGQVQVMQTEMVLKFAIDYDRGLFYRAKANAREEDPFIIVDIKNKKLHSFKNAGDCETTDAPLAIQYFQCLDAEDNIGINPLGARSRDIYVDEYIYEVLHRTFRKTVSHYGDYCYPVTVRVSGDVDEDADENINTFLFYDVVDFIQFDRIYTNLTDC